MSESLFEIRVWDDLVFCSPGSAWLTLLRAQAVHLVLCARRLRDLYVRVGESKDLVFYSSIVNCLRIRCFEMYRVAISLRLENNMLCPFRLDLLFSDAVSFVFCCPVCGGGSLRRLLLSRTLFRYTFHSQFPCQYMKKISRPGYGLSSTAVVPM